jgi:hypothetical protein
MNVYQSSVLEIAATDNRGGKSSDHDGVTPPFQKILDLAVDPIMESAIMKSKEKKKLRPRWDARCSIQRVLEQRIREIVAEHVSRPFILSFFLALILTDSNRSFILSSIYI